MGKLKGGAKIQRRRLLLYCLNDGPAIVTRMTTPQASKAIEHGLAVVGLVVHAVCTCQHTRCRLEVAIGGKGHPIRIQLIAM